MERPFHLIISTRFKERVDSPDELIILPTLGGLQIVGDERRAMHADGATSYSETLSVVAHAPGTVRVGAAYFNAIDARNGKPSRFSSNELTFTVTDAAGNGHNGLHNLSLRLAQLALLALALFAVSLVWRAAGNRRMVPAAFPEMPPAKSEDPVTAPAGGLEGAVVHLQETRSRDAVLGVREVLREMVNAKNGATLNDILHTLDGRTQLHTVLRATERAAFIGEGHLPAAIDEMIAALHWYRA
ncbi:MAG: hypothetical protein GIW98_05705 [Candidatus Eremiobacteraeota bacterium]|nr:hypothetical protein [Candidatus Eremiobacteraeota bacterium]